MWLLDGRRSGAITALALAAGAAATLVAAPAHADDFTVTHSNLNTSTASSCATIPLTWNAVVNPDAQNWGLDGDVINAAGASVHLIYEYEQAAVTTVTDTFTLCGLAVGANTFRLAVTAKAYDWTYPYTGDRTLNIDELFTVTYTPPPPPPPPAPETWTTRLTLDKSVWIKKDNVARFGGSVEIAYTCPHSSCFGQERKVKVQALRNGNWTTIYTRSGISSTAYLKVPVPYKYTKIRAKVARLVSGYVTYTADKSNTIRVPRK